MCFGGFGTKLANVLEAYALISSQKLVYILTIQLCWQQRLTLRHFYASLYPVGVEVPCLEIQVGPEFQMLTPGEPSSIFTG